MTRTFNFEEKHVKEIRRQYNMLHTSDENNILNKRQYGNDGYTDRNPFQRDLARILYSPSFRRLQGKMQIVGINTSAFYRNRLTHSLEVAQIATSIARILARTCHDDSMYIDDLHLIEAAALAHDIGHPAFGHKGERVLNKLGHKYSINFEGNAQNFRVLRYLEKKEPGHRGLNLTNRTLLAINKYIVREADSTKKFMYSDDYDYLMDVRSKAEGLKGVRTLDVQIIELADDIAYAVHDLEDGLSLRNFTIDEILFMLKKKSSEAYDLFKDIVDEALEYSDADNIDNVQDHSKLFRMRLTSRLTDTFIMDITVRDVTEDEAKQHGTRISKELSLGKYKKLLDNLKKVVFTCTTRDNSVQLYESRGEVVLNTLFSIYSDPKVDEDGKLMPPDYRPGLEWKKCKNSLDQKKKYMHELAQCSIDYIAGMMDTFAIEEFEQLTHLKFDDIDILDLGKDIAHE